MKIIGIVFSLMLGAFLIAVIATLPVYFLWNWLMPHFFSLKECTLFQAFGLSWLSSILFQSNNSKDASS